MRSGVRVGAGPPFAWCGEVRSVKPQVAGVSFNFGVGVCLFVCLCPVRIKYKNRSGLAARGAARRPARASRGGLPPTRVLDEFVRSKWVRQDTSYMPKYAYSELGAMTPLPSHVLDFPTP